MPTLFISYKRGTSGIIPLMERLRGEHYRLWYDKEDIHAGENWRESINRGVDSCDALIVGLTSDACQSEFVRYEVKRAIEQGKLIYPVKMEAIDEGKDPQLLGLTDIQFIDFTAADPNTWNTAFQKLLADMQRHNKLKITNRVIRQERGTQAHTLHQRYLKKLVSRIGTLSLANISSDASGTLQLEDVYIDSPTQLSISVEVKDWHIVRWGISAKDGKTWRSPPKEIEIGERQWTDLWWQVEDLGFTRTSIEALIGDIDVEIQEYHKDNPDLKANEESPYRNHWNNGIKENVVTLEIQDIATARDRLVVLGQPGSGKSTFVKHLALCLAGEQIEDWTRDAQLSSLRHWLHKNLTPIYIELPRFVASAYFPSDIHTQPTETDLWQYIEHEILGTDLEGYLAELKYDVENEHALIILDGLDEIPYPEGQLALRQQQIISLAEILNSPHFAKCRVLVASRPYAYEGWKLPNFEAITITDFTDKHRVALASNLYKASGLTHEQAQEKAQALNQQLGNIDPQLKDRPLFLTLMATVYLRGEKEGLPTRRGALYRESVMLLLDRWTSSKRADAVTLIDILGDKSTDELYERLAALAYEVHTLYGEQQGTPEIDEMLLYKHLKPLGRSTAAELIPYLSENAGILVSPGQDEEKDVFHFAHRTFQEYLAASHIAKTCIETDSYKRVYDLITAKPQAWRVPCALVGDVLADTAQKSKLWSLLADLLEDEPPQEQDNPAWWAAWLASEIAIEQELYLQEKLNRRTEQSVRDGLVEWLVALLKIEGLFSTERNECGQALGLLGDPRQGIGLRSDSLPDILWSKEIPHGKYIFQGEEITFTYSYKLAKYPVTVMQFLVFVQNVQTSTDTYMWSNLFNSEELEYLRETTLKYPNAICTEVSWNQAVAFCKWLTRKYHVAGLLGKSLQIRLPTEREWEVAVEYPYSKAYDNLHRSDNNKTKPKYDTGFDAVTAGIFPSESHPHLGIEDLSNGRWEWCLDEFYDPDNIQMFFENYRVLRRIGWDRDEQSPTSAFSNLVFRVCLAPVDALDSVDEE